MKRISVQLLLGLVLLLGLALAPALAFDMTIAPSGESVEPPGMDSSQPDTIKYDTEGAQFSYYYGATNWYLHTRFTAPSDFSLRCIYLRMFNPYAVADGNTTAIFSDNGAGQPDTLITGPYHNNGPLWGGFLWLDVEIDQPFPTVPAGSDFHVVWGPAPMGPLTQGWFPAMDINGNTDGRSGYSANPTGPFTAIDGDLFCRVGGVVASFTDLTVLNCYNDTQKFFMEPGATIVYKAEVKNLGSQDVTTYRVIWTVQDTLGGTEFFADSADYGALVSGQTALQVCPSAWTAQSAGYYIASARVWHQDDLVENNVAHLEQGICALGENWYTYDDGVASTNMSGNVGEGWGNRFIPSSYPVQVDSVSVGVAGNLVTSDVRIMSLIGTTFTMLYNYTGPLVAGMNPIDLTAQNIVLFEGSLCVGYMYQVGGSIYKDGDIPIAATNSRMPAVSYDIQGTAWTAAQSGDWMLRAFLSESSALPPYPVMRIEPDDTLDFGEVTVDVADTAYLWFFSEGAPDLVVTDINPAPAQIVDEVFVTDTAFTLATPDSHQVMVIWVPNAVGPMFSLAKLAIFNNDTSPFPLNLPLRGTAMAVGVQPIEGSAPVSYALQGNFPNPFNASTSFVLSLPVAGPVSFKIYDISGREVASLAQGSMQAGSYELTFDASNLTSGVYLARVVAGSFQATQKLVLLK